VTGSQSESGTGTGEAYAFAAGSRTAETVDRVYDELDLSGTVSAYRFYYPSVSIYTVFGSKGESDGW
jgi:hypothetical protein